jgi:prepilin-type N-terminal cleavage/methylation domain-containing protein
MFTGFIHTCSSVAQFGNPRLVYWYYMLQNQATHKGFTLIELMVVITIIGLLASTVLASLQSSRVAARDAQRIQEARQLINALELYRNQNGRYPCSGVAMACAAGSAGAAQVVLKNTSGTYAGMAATLRTGLNFNPNRDAINATSLAYRVRSTTGNDNNPDPTSYTIVVYQEQLNTYCEINIGPGHSGYAYSSCEVSGL